MLNYSVAELRFDITLFGIITDTDCKDRTKNNIIKAFLLLFFHFSSNLLFVISFQGSLSRKTVLESLSLKDIQLIYFRVNNIRSMKIIYYFCKVYVTISQYKRNRTIHHHLDNKLLSIL